MFEIVQTVGLSTIVVIAITIGIPWFVSKPRERALEWRYACLGALFCATTAGWVLGGIYTFLYLPEFWRGVYWGATAVLWLGYLPALVLIIRAVRRRSGELQTART